MKPFDLQAALDGGPICTRAGRDAYLIGTKINHPEKPIVAIVVCGDGKERPYSFTETGREISETIDGLYDLFMAPTVKERWANLLRRPNGSAYMCSVLYMTKEDAIQSAKRCDFNLIDTFLVRWEE